LKGNDKRQKGYNTKGSRNNNNNNYNNNNSNNGGKKFNGNCHYCNKPGHTKADCYKYKADNAERGHVARDEEMAFFCQDTGTKHPNGVINIQGHNVTYIPHVHYNDLFRRARTEPEGEVEYCLSSIDFIPIIEDEISTDEIFYLEMIMNLIIT
jgi:hypothetical protein